MRVRRWARWIAVALLSVLVLGFVAYGALFIPAVYFRVAFFIVQRYALMRDRVDWVAVRAETDDLMRGARSTRDTYPAIRLVLQRLGDHHSHLADPETVRAHRAGSNLTLGLTAIWPEAVVAVVTAGSPAEEAGIRAGDLIEAVDGSAPAHVDGVVLMPRGPKAVDLLVRRAGRTEPLHPALTPRVVPFNRPATVRRLGDVLGYIDVPGVVGGGDSFDRDAVAAIRDVDTIATCGWIVDLRRNVGGNMWPMLHALRPILGEGNPFTYRYGRGPFSQTPVYSLKQPRPAIAVLTSRLTVSSGELVTVAFRGPSTTRTFGEATGGLSTSNMTIPLVDGAMLVVTVSRAVDRVGRVYDGPLQPDQPIGIDWTRVGSEDDPVLRVAARWLREQEPCASPRQLD